MSIKSYSVLTPVLDKNELRKQKFLRANNSSFMILDTRNDTESCFVKLKKSRDEARYRICVMCTSITTNFSFKAICLTEIWC